MSDDELTEIHDGFEQTLRTMLMAASKVRERVAERRAEAAQQQQRHASQAEDAATRGYTVHQSALAAELAPVHRDDWWQQASPTRIARLWELSDRFADGHPEAAAARNQLREQMQHRYNIDPERVRADNRDLTTAIRALADDDKQAARESAHRTSSEHPSAEDTQAVRETAHTTPDAPSSEDSIGQQRAASTEASPTSAANYQRARPEDMPTVDAATSARRVAVAEAFPQPAGHLSRSGHSGRSQQTQARPQQQHKQPKRTR